MGVKNAVTLNFVTNKGLEYAKAFIFCFTKDTTDSYMTKFAHARYINLVDEDVKAGELLSNCKEDYKDDFIKTFKSEIRRLLPIKHKLDPFTGDDSVSFEKEAD